MRFERNRFGQVSCIFQFPDMVSVVRYVGLNTNDDAREILRMLKEANR